MYPGLGGDVGVRVTISMVYFSFPRFPDCSFFTSPCSCFMGAPSSLPLSSRLYFGVLLPLISVPIFHSFAHCVVQLLWDGITTHLPVGGVGWGSAWRLVLSGELCKDWLLLETYSRISIPDSDECHKCEPGLTLAGQVGIFLHVNIWI